MARYVDPRPQYFDNAGAPLVEGKVFIFESGSNTLKDIFRDVNESIAAENPVILSASGRMPNTFFSGSARGKLTDADEVQFWDIDPIGSSTGEGAFSDWNAETIYDIPDIVVGTDDRFYQSITNGNQGNDPTVDLVNWSEIKFIGVYNANQTYSINDVVQGSDGLLYKSNTNSNTGNNPVTDSVNWTLTSPTVVYSDQSYWMGL